MQGERRRELSTLPARVVLVLDGLVVVGSVLMLTWSIALGEMVEASPPGTFAFVVALAYPSADLTLVVMFMLLLATKPVPVHLRRELGLLGSGLIGLSVSDGIFAYLVASGADDLPLPTNIGFIVGPVLVGLAALSAAQPQVAATRASMPRLVEWAHLLLPYAPLVATGILMVGRQVAGDPVDAVEVYLGTVVVALVVVRQLITLIDNKLLLGRVYEVQQRLRHAAYHDPLTGLANRDLFRARVVAALGQHGRRPAALYFVDLDDFKLVNDSLGHSAGDRLLQAVGERLRSCVRGADTVARLGGDEFGVLAEANVDHPDRLGERMLSALREPYELDGPSVTVGASVGAAVPDGDAGLTADVLLRRADIAMYASKRRGKGRFVRYDPDSGADHHNPDLPGLLAEALEAADGFDVQYQPIVRMGDGGEVAIEALARWTHPRAGMVPPAVFVAMAERAGLISTLDNLVLERSCRDLAARLARGGGATAVHVNMSVIGLSNTDLPERVDSMLVRHGLDPHQLVLELTANGHLVDPAVTATAAQRLRAMGVRLALDGFGTSHNAMTHLHALPLDMVKLDPSLTAEAGRVSGARAEAVCRSVVTIAAELGLVVVAGGVESSEQAAALSRAGCCFGQGYHYGRPESWPRPITL